MKDRTLAILSGTSFVVFLAIAVAVKALPSLTDQDLQGALWVNHLALGGPVSSFVVAASVYGREYFWIPLVGVMLLLGDRRTKLVALGLSGVFVGGIVLGEAAKAIMERARPDQYLLQAGSQISAAGGPIIRTALSTDYSFPSGHALITSIGAVYSVATLRRKWLAALLTLEAALVCFGRVYTFEHYPTDVVAGFAFGSAIALAGIVVERRYFRAQGERVVGLLVRLFRDGPLRL